MKIAVYGATGAIGSVIVTEASARGHQVTGISRRGGDLTGDALDPVFTADVAANHDVVVSAISGRAGPRTTAPASRTASPTWPTLSATDGCSSSAEPAALPSTASGCSTHRSYPKSLKGADSLALLRAAADDVDWTYLSPAPVILPGQRTGSYKVELDTPAGDQISIEDYAVALVDEIENPAHARQRFAVGRD